MSAINEVLEIGRVVREPKTFAHEKGTSVIFTIAVNKRNGQDEPDWIECHGFINVEHPNHVYDYLHKGTLIVTKGELHSYKDKNNYTQRQYDVYNIELLGSKPKNKKTQTKTPAQGAPTSTDTQSLDETAPKEGTSQDNTKLEDQNLQEQIENLPLGK